MDNLRSGWSIFDNLVEFVRIADIQAIREAVHCDVGVHPVDTMHRARQAGEARIDGNLTLRPGNK